jgi:glycosyltransferase involved in cell wall biosynthesis
VGVPVVCTPVGVNRDLVEDGVNGLWATTQEEWEEKLSLLIEDRATREKLGREGRKRVMKGYTIQACAPHLLSILKKVMEKS